MFLNRLNGFISPGGSRAVFDPRFLFAGGEKGGIWLPENSDVGVGSGVGTVTDISPNTKNATQGAAGNKPVLRQNATTGALYLEFDGSDDWLETTAIDLTGTDKVTVFAAVRKLSDAAAGCVAEFSATSGGNSKTFAMLAPAGAAANFFWRSYGAASADATTASSFASPYSAVLTGQGNIPADVSTLRLNGSQVATSATDQGTSNYGNFTLYIGRRGGATLPLNGHLYGLIVIGRTCTATEIAATESFLNRRIGAY